MSKTVLATAMIVCVALAGAQGGQGGGQGRGNRGGFGGFAQGRGGGQGEMQLAFRKDVQTDIGVTTEQKTKLDELQAKQRQGRGGGQGQGRGNRGGNGGAGAGGNGGGAGTNGGGNGGNGGNGGAAGGFNNEEFRKRMEEQRTQARKDLAAILSETQMKRIGEIQVQLQGNRALMQADTQKSLGMSSDQVKKVEDLQAKQREANQALTQKMRDQSLSREEAMKSFENNNKILDAELHKVLTADQATKFKAMGGKPFKADPPPARGGGGGGR